MTARPHPTPWRVGDYTNAAGIYDARGTLVESVYGRPGDPTGVTLATRIADAVNAAEAHLSPCERCHGSGSYEVSPTDRDPCGRCKGTGVEP